MKTKLSEHRAGAPAEVQAQRFGPLTDLAGTWAGRGFTLISKPAFELKLPFVLQVNATIETLTITPIGGPIPDRGSQQDDIFVAAMNYTHEVTDAATLSLLHVEQGMWLNVPPSKTPLQPHTVVRLATVPHGDVVLAQGVPASVRRPKFPVASPVPVFHNDGKSAAAGLFPPKPFKPPRVNPFPLPPGFDLDNPNAALGKAIEGQTILKTVVLPVSTLPSATSNANMMNIPFVINNACPVGFDATFYLETVKLPAGDPFLQLQYTQTTILNFPPKRGPITSSNPLINWPHISVATLVKQ